MHTIAGRGEGWVIGSVRPGRGTRYIALLQHDVGSVKIDEAWRIGVWGGSLKAHGWVVCGAAEGSKSGRPCGNMEGSTGCVLG